MAQYRDIQISKCLSWLLRHGAQKEGLNIQKDGFIDVKSLLNHHSLKQKRCTKDDIIRIVKQDGKNRYTLIEDETNVHELRIKANQGHSMKDVNKLSLNKVTSPTEIPIVVHGTYFRCWPKIKSEGLNRMNRNHIHFSRTANIPNSVTENSSTKISGFRGNSEILIFIDVQKAMEDGIEFFISENNVILSTGKNNNGIIESKYFSKVVDKKTDKLLSV